MNFKDKELIIFDLDGTIVNSIPDLTLGVNKMLSHYDLPNLSIEEVSPFIGNGAEALIHRALNFVLNDQNLLEKLRKEALAIFLLAYEEVICNETFMYPNVLETLNYLNENQYKMVICSNKPFKFIEPILDKLSIKKFFKHWIGENSLPNKKPDAAPLLHLANLLSVDLEKCIMVGDSKNDILAAQNSGIESIGVSYGYNYNENIADYKPSKVINNFIELQLLF